ncbi:hypothetical protein PAAG_12001 [Paracoccidioides lutzii Pb01]|uniref:Uncharacterized protein n=1 Tax=Paracoccidioides lutzii (strain ATCC MYA-826 / Pb01) TaxID=502779 RepID=A0A0A2V0J4_PARBA|nr:hypothetical protein PAAG_12001 [Paracoccidioides lutzii Pb01]KGQ01321.1 hypothetical protein PAAG_12001 [Paracoccidioides lutzii Pb01]
MSGELPQQRIRSQYAFFLVDVRSFSPSREVQMGHIWRSVIGQVRHPSRIIRPKVPCDDDYTMTLRQGVTQALRPPPILEKGNRVQVFCVVLNPDSILIRCA